MIKERLRKHGQKPYSTAVIHGGPGAPGEVRPVAERLSSECGVLEPIQTEFSVEDQVDELKDILLQYGNPPFKLVGHSWGAWLSYIFAAIHPDLVEKAVLIAGPPFREKYAGDIRKTRLERLEEKERAEAEDLFGKLEGDSGDDDGETLLRLRELIEKADSYDPLPDEEAHRAEIQPEMYRRIWGEARDIRQSGELIELAEFVESPVVAIHGSYDPHPAEGVREPLSQALEDFRFVLLEKCGHTPWLERKARDKFYAILEGLLD